MKEIKIAWHSFVSATSMFATTHAAHQAGPDVPTRRIRGPAVTTTI